MTFLRRHWLAIAAVIGALILIFWVGFGIGHRWGTSQWGPFADWFTGTITLAAVVVALREALRGQGARHVDHELARRRECLKALGDFWAAVMQVGLEFPMFLDYLKNLPREFNPTRPRQDDVQQQNPVDPLAADYAQQIVQFWQKWAQFVEPQVFYAFAVLRNTPLDDGIRDVVSDADNLRNAAMKPITQAVLNGRRPSESSIEDLNAQWSTLVRRRQEHLDLAREFFSLKLDDVERALRG